MSALVRYEAARAALAAAVMFDEVKSIMDAAERAALYAKQAQDTDLIEKATEIRVRAERRAGEMLAQTEKATGARLNGRTPDGASAVTQGNRRETATLAEMGITKKQSSHYQQLAAMPADHFETAVATAKATAGEVTTAFMLREAKAGKPHGKPATGKAADAARAALRQAQERPQSRLCVYARQTLAEIEGQAEFSHEERQALESLRTAIDRLSITH